MREAWVGIPAWRIPTIREAQPKRKRKKKGRQEIQQGKTNLQCLFLKNLYSTLKETEIKIRILVTKPEN